MLRPMKKALFVVLALAVAYYAFDQPGQVFRTDSPTGPAVVQPERVVEQQRSGSQMQGAGTVTRILSDDNDGSRHQRFILRLGSGQTLLIAHNIDLAPRVSSLREGDRVSFYGEYEWNERGGVIHWTHHDPQGRHPAGWLEHNGRRYQ